MEKIKKEIIFLILCILSVLGTIASFIFLQQYIPEYFIYINNNWNNGYTAIEHRGRKNCTFPLLKDTSIKMYKTYKKDFFNNEIVDDNVKNEENIKNYYFISFNQRQPHCLDNKTNYFDINLNKYVEGNDFANCKFIDSLNNTSCENYNGTSKTITDYSKFTEVVFAQDQPCLDPRYYNFNMTFNKTSYYYDKVKCPGGKTNKHYHRIENATILAIIFYNNMTELNDTISDEIKLQNFYVYGRNYIGIKDECRNKPFKELNNDLDKYNNYIKSSIAWIGYISLIEIIFFLLFLNRFTVKYHNYLNNNNNNNNSISNENENHKVKELLPPYTKPVILILSLIMLGFHILVFTYLLNIENFIDLFNDISCFEEEAGQLIKPSIIYLKIGRYTQITVLAINVILAYKYGIKKGIKYAN